jgi:tRNA pseudouridine38-40 synthase
MHHGRLTTVRTIEACEVSRVRASESTLLPDVEPQADIVQVRVRGTGFLYNMVRIIAGTLLDVGRGRLSEDVFARIYETRDRRLAGQTLPPNGLCLEWIEHATSKPAMLETGALETGADETGADGAGVDETGRENRE